MKYFFITSLIPYMFLIVHSIKTLNIYFILYSLVYGIHLTGRPFYFDVVKWYQFQRAFELCLFTPYKIFVCPLLFMGSQIHKSSLYALFVFMSDQYILSTLLLFVICLHDIPINPKELKNYFYVRMIKNVLIFFMMFNKTNLTWFSLPVIFVVSFIYYVFKPTEKVDTEYFLNSAPITYPVPLDIKDAIKHCKTAKILFKKSAV